MTLQLWHSHMTSLSQKRNIASYTCCINYTIVLTNQSQPPIAITCVCSHNNDDSIDQSFAWPSLSTLARTIERESKIRSQFTSPTTKETI